MGSLDELASVQRRSDRNIFSSMSSPIFNSRPTSPLVASGAWSVAKSFSTNKLPARRSPRAGGSSWMICTSSDVQGAGTAHAARSEASHTMFSGSARDERSAMRCAMKAMTAE